jgi:hypothetical protein
MFASLAFTRPEVGSSIVTVQKSFLAVLGLVGTMGCWERVDARAEANALMTSLNAVSDEGSFVERSAALQRLNQLPLHFAAHAQTRDVCGAAHKGLLEAEIAQAEARRALTSAGEGTPQPMLEKVQAEGIAADIERSNRSLALAKERFPECEKAMRGLLREAR